MVTLRKLDIQMAQEVHRRFPDLPLEPVAFTPDEFSKAKWLLVWDILEDGIVFKNTGVFSQRKKQHERLKKEGKLKKVKWGWKFAS